MHHALPHRAPPAHPAVRSDRFQLVRTSVWKLAVAVLAAPLALACAGPPPRGGPPPSGADRVRPVPGQQQLRLRAPHRPARPLRGHAGDDHADGPPTPRAPRGSELGGRRARRRPRAVRGAVLRRLHRSARADPRHARPARLRPARHRPLAPALLPRLRTARLLPLRRRAAHRLRRTDRARTRLLHHPRLGRRHRGAAPRGGLRKARAVGHLLRHQGRRAVRPAVPLSTSKRSSSTPSCRPPAPTRWTARRSKRCPASCASCAPTTSARTSHPPPSATSRGSCGACTAAR